MVRVGVTYDGQAGEIAYDSGNVTLHGLPDDKVADVRRYLNAPREFHLERTDLIDTYQQVTARPIDNEDWFKLGTLTLFAETGVWVDSVQE